MKIADSTLQLAASSVSLQEQTRQESLRVWVGRPPSEALNNQTRPVPSSTQVDLSSAGQQAAAAEYSDENNLEHDPRSLLISRMIEALTGHQVKLFKPSELQEKAADTASTASSTPPAGWGMAYDLQTRYSEYQETHFSANGSVTTADGRQINFQLELSMSRYYHEESSVSVRAGDAAIAVDPLVLNFSGNAASLTDQRFAFDLTADGQEEQIARLASGSGYLVFDRNQNGRADNGHELFGPRSGDGFAELVSLDQDRNGWIDENDEAYAQLSLWTPAAGEGLQSLASTGVGAIALARVDTPFELKNNANELLGQTRNSGIFLHEDGSAGTIQQIDLHI
ncbi:MAG: VCBS repeat-containing protein [Dechloromonas sp.]|nr:VCBS repeat-containing protein [Dechloromonas sp.]